MGYRPVDDCAACDHDHGNFTLSDGKVDRMSQRILLRPARSRRGGNVLVLVGVSLVTLFAVTGLVIDGGRMMSERRHAQNAADAAALAAAIDLYKGKSATYANATALVY